MAETQDLSSRGQLATYVMLLFKGNPPLNNNITYLNYSNSYYFSTDTEEASETDIPNNDEPLEIKEQ